MGLSIYMACLREKKTVFHGEELSRCLELVQVLLRYGGDSYAYINRNRLFVLSVSLLDKGRSLNTVSTYMRRIRHIYNLAVEANEAPFVPNLFKDVFTGR